MTSHVGSVSPSRKARADGRELLLAFPAALMLIGALIPFAAVAGMAFSEGPHHAWNAVADDLFLLSVRRTVVMAAIVSLGCLVLGAVFALALAVCGSAARWFLLGALLASFSISLVVRTYGWIVALQPQGALYWALERLGLRDKPLDLLQTNTAMYVGMLHVMLPYSVLLLASAVQTVDAASLRAAQSMGARPLRILVDVVLPQVRVGVQTAVVLVFIMSLGFLVTPLFLGPPNALTISTVIDLQLTRFYDFAAAASIGLTLLVAVIATYLVAERLFGISKTWAES